MKLDLRAIVETLTVEPARLPFVAPHVERDALPPPFNQSRHVRIQARIVGAGALACGRLDLRTADPATVKAVADACESKTAIPLAVTPVEFGAV